MEISPIPKSKPDIPIYTISQLTDSFKTFNTTRAIVDTALKLSKKTSFTLDEARKIINNFKTRR